MSDLGSTVEHNADSAGSTVSSDASGVSRSYASGGVMAAGGTLGDDTSSGGEDFLWGGNLQKAYLLILPPSSPAGGAAAAALCPAGIGAEDLTGTSGGTT